MAQRKVSDEELNGVTGGAKYYPGCGAWEFECKMVPDDETFKYYFQNGADKCPHWVPSNMGPFCEFCVNVKKIHHPWSY